MRLLVAASLIKPAHGKYMYTYMETPRGMLHVLVEKLYGIGKSL